MFWFNDDEAYWCAFYITSLLYSVKQIERLITRETLITCNLWRIAHWHLTDIACSESHEVSQAWIQTIALQLQSLGAPKYRNIEIPGPLKPLQVRRRTLEALTCYRTKGSGVIASNGKQSHEPWNSKFAEILIFLFLRLPFFVAFLVKLFVSWSKKCLWPRQASCQLGTQPFHAPPAGFHGSCLHEEVGFEWPGSLTCSTAHRLFAKHCQTPGQPNKRRKTVTCLFSANDRCGLPQGGDGGPPN